MEIFRQNFFISSKKSNKTFELDFLRNFKNGVYKMDSHEEKWVG